MPGSLWNNMTQAKNDRYVNQCKLSRIFSQLNSNKTVYIRGPAHVSSYWVLRYNNDSGPSCQNTSRRSYHLTEEKECSGSVTRLWMFTSHTTKSGMPVSGKRGSGGMESTPLSAELME